MHPPGAVPALVVTLVRCLIFCALLASSASAQNRIPRFRFGDFAGLGRRSAAPRVESGRLRIRPGLGARQVRFDARIDGQPVRVEARLRRRGTTLELPDALRVVGDLDAPQHRAMQRRLLAAIADAFPNALMVALRSPEPIGSQHGELGASADRATTDARLRVVELAALRQRERTSQRHRHGAVTRNGDRYGFSSRLTDGTRVEVAFRTEIKRGEWRLVVDLTAPRAMRQALRVGKLDIAFPRRSRLPNDARPELALHALRYLRDAGLSRDLASGRVLIRGEGVHTMRMRADTLQARLDQLGPMETRPPRPWWRPFAGLGGRAPVPR